MEYSLTGAATATGSSKSKIHRMIKDGRLSARRMDDGSYRIDASELGRVFSSELAEPSQRNAVRRDETAAEPAGTTGTELAELRVKVELLERLLTERKDTIENLRKDLDEERAERRAIQRQLMPPASSAKPPEGPFTSPTPVEPSKPSRSLLSRLWGR
jgi:hypothetical protein